MSRVLSLAIKFVCTRTGTIIGDGDNKSWDPRAPMVGDSIKIENGLEVVTFRDQMVRVERFSCGFFTAKAETKTGKKNQDSSMHSYALSL